MVRINLLKNSSKKHPAGGHFPRAVGITTLGVIVAGLLVFGAIKGSAWYGAHQEKPKPKEVLVVKQAALPSTYSPSNMVEDVVKEVSDSRLKLRETGMLNLPYDQLSFAEKINYEYLFAKNVCEMLSRTVPGGIGLKSLELDNFQTVYASGLGSSKDLIHEMLTSLKNEKLKVLPPPYSFIKPNAREGFRFAFSCNTEFGLNLTDPLVNLSLAGIGSRDAIPKVLESFSKIAKQNKITFSKAPALVSTDKVGNYYRSIYHWAGICSYTDFVKLVGGLYSEKVPCAVKQCSLLAQSASVVKIESQLVITTKD